MNLSANNFNRIASLDGLRAISIIMVLISHAALTVGMPEGIRVLIFHANLGTLGVRIFFVISGFLITTLLLKEESELGAISLVNFYKRRCLRIFPVYFSYIVFVMMIGWLFPMYWIPISTCLSAATFTTFLWGYWGDSSSMYQTWFLAHTWSLSVEEQFYLLWPAFLILSKSQPDRRRAVAILMIAVALLARFLLVLLRWEPKFNCEIFLTNADSIMFGCLLAIVLDADKRKMTDLFFYRPFFFRTIAIVVISIPFAFGARAFLILGPTLQSPAIAYLIGSYTIVRKGKDYLFLNQTWLVYIGGLSYSLYIWQQFILAPPSVVPTTWFNQFPQNLGIVAFLAIFSYYVIEQPILGIKRRYARLRTSSR